MANWRAIALLPNIDVDESVEGGLMALVGHGDPRLRALRRSEPNFNRFLGRFTDAFGVNIKPAVLIQQADAPEWARKIDAIASFRDAVAIATVPYNRALEINYARGHRITFSNWFWLYPWMVDRNDEHLIANTPGMLALHQVSKFRGQSAPEIPPMTLSSRDLDEATLQALLLAGSADTPARGQAGRTGRSSGHSTWRSRPHRCRPGWIRPSMMSAA